MEHIVKLKLDLAINGIEYWVGDAPATIKGFKSLVRHDWIRNEDDMMEIQETGAATVNLISDEYVEMFRDILGRDDISDIFEANFIMCLWQVDEETGTEEHLESCYTLESLQGAI